MNNSKRKNRLNAGRAPRVRGPERNVAAEGIYNNSQFMHAITCHIGSTIQLLTHNGSTYEGIFRTFSSQFEVVLEMAHKIDPNDPDRIGVDNIIEKLIFKPSDIIELKIVDVDLEFAAKGVAFQTDTAISKYNGQAGEKELEPWDETGYNGEDLELDGTTANGWDVNEMFRKNEQMYGVTSSFDTTMSGYTVPLTKRDTKEFKDAEMKAAKIANEIENNPTYKARIELENDEEEKYAAVVRPNENNNTNDNIIKPYVPPAKRKTTQNIKVVKNTSVASGSASKPPVYPSSPPTTLINNTQVSFHNASSPFNTTQANGSQTSSTTSYPNAQREQRINGQVDMPPPKSQRVPVRTGRNFPCPDTNTLARYEDQNGSLEVIRTIRQSSPTEQSMSPPKHLNPPHTHTIPVQSTSTSSPHPVSFHSQQSLQEQNKPSAVDQHNSILPTTISGRKIRGREEQLSELKKFGADFKLSDSNEEKKAHTIVPVSSITASSVATTTANTIRATNEAEQRLSEMSKEQLNGEMDKATSAIKKSTLNPNAKEFNPNVKTFIPRSPSTPTPSRPHTPQTPSYGPGPSLPAMVLPTTFVVTTGQPAFSATPNQGSRYRKVPMTMSHRPDIASQMQVAAATGQPLLAPAPIHTQFTVPYSPQGHIPAQPYQQMVRMVAQQGGGMVPLVPSLNYHHDSPTQQPPQIQYMSPAPMAPPHPHHPHHHPHPPPNTAPSPGQSGQAPQGMPGHSTTGAFHHTPQSPAGSYPQPPPPPPQGPHPPNGPPTHTFPIMCPIIPAPAPPPGSHNPHHMMTGAQAPYLHHHHQHQGTVGSQPHIQVILPHGQ